MKKAAIAFAAAVAIVAILITGYAIACGSAEPVAIGQLWMLALTLIVLVWYAYDTNSIATVTRQRWLREAVLSTSYEVALIGRPAEAGRTLFRIHNSSNLVVLANVNCNFHVDGQRVKAGSLYDGEERWVVFPQERLQGWFEVEDLARKVGKTIEDMCRERTLLNRTKQLTMLLELEFRDELGEERRLPPRHWYFDFVRWSWIPHIGERASL